MMIENEHKLTLTQASKRIPGRPHASTLWRHISKGFVAADGSRIFLEHMRYGRRIFTSLEAVERFAKHIAEASYVPHGRTDEDRRSTWKKPQEASDDLLANIDHELDEEGF